VVLKTSTRQTIFLPVIGLVDAAELKPNDLVGVNKDSYLVLDKLPAEYDSRVKAMEVLSRYIPFQFGINLSFCVRTWQLWFKHFKSN
jgi:ATP-dependent 26S proteasome regulatory subunit